MTVAAQGGTRTVATAAVLLSVSALFWAGNYVIGRAIAGEVPPAGLAAARWIVAILALLPIAWPHLARDIPVLLASWRVILLLGLTGMAAFGTLQYLGLQFTTATNGGLIGGTTPLFIALAGALMFGDRLTWRQGLGLALSFAGILTIVAQGEVANLLLLRFNGGDLLILATLVSWAVYCTVLRLKPAVHWTSFAIGTFAVGAVANIPFAAAEQLAGVGLRANLTTALTVAYTGLLASAIGYGTWNRGVELIGSQRAGLFLNLVPLFSVVLAYALLGERLEPFHALAFVTIVAGLWLGSIAPRAAPIRG